MVIRRVLLPSLTGLLLLVSGVQVECGELSDKLALLLPHETVSTRTARPTPDSLKVERTQEARLLIGSLHKIYKLVLSSQDRPGCNFVQGCSNYAKEAVYRYGLFWGGLMASDRLLRCNGFGQHYYDIDTATGRCIDPVTNNAPHRH